MRLGFRSGWELPERSTALPLQGCQPTCVSHIEMKSRPAADRAQGTCGSGTVCRALRLGICPRLDPGYVPAASTGSKFRRALQRFACCGVRRAGWRSRGLWLPVVAGSPPNSRHARLKARKWFAMHGAVRVPNARRLRRRRPAFSQFTNHK